MGDDVILYRESQIQEEELEAMKRFFKVTDSRMTLKKDDYVIGRYSVLPFYREQEKDIRSVGARLINSYGQHRYAADLGFWTEDLKDYTPKTWKSNQIPELPEFGSFVLKGETNSKKFLWDTHMFAPKKSDVPMILGRLLDDTLISDQMIYVREFVPLVTYMHGLHGLPITKEFRVFGYGRQIVSAGFYWSSHVGDLEEAGINIPSPLEIPGKWLNEVIDRVSDGISYYAVDVAQTVDDRWLVIDLNDGQMSGLSTIDPVKHYRSLRELINR